MEKAHIFGGLFILILVVLPFLMYQSQGIKRAYQKEATMALKLTTPWKKSVLRAEDIKNLPHPIQNYLAYTGVINKEKIQNVKIAFAGVMKLDPKKDWVQITSEQYNFFDPSTRVFYIRGNMSGIPILGLHLYKQGHARMLIKIAGLVTVADARGPEMDMGETVTVFNDMCLLAPASLIDQRIQWETINDLTVKATFHHNGCNISALLYFNKEGALTNFVTEDRYMTTSGNSYQKVKWSTPVKEYKEFNGLRLPGKAEAIWHLPEGDYCYAKFDVKNVACNRQKFE